MANKIKVFVVTDTEGGWNCVRGVFPTAKAALESREITYQEGKDEFHDYDDNSPYVIHEETLILE